MLGQRRREVVLRVEDPDPSHVGRNIITLDKKTKEMLGVTSGDIVEIEGTKKTASVIWPARAEDEGKGIIRMDNLIRNNSGVGLGEKVTVRKIQYVEAKRVVLAPTQEVRIIASGYDRILKKNFIGRPLNRGDHVWISVFGSGFVYKVVDTIPRGIVKITDFTQFILKEEPVKEDISSLQKIAYEDIGGLEEQIQKIREMIELPMRHPEIFRKLGINPPKGVLLHGPPGTGKTLLAKAVANETQAHFIAINSPGIMSKFVGEAEERIRDVFKEAEKNAPSIVFFDEIDSIAPKRDEVIGEVERRVVAQILSAMDGMEARGNVIVIAASVTGDTPILVKKEGNIQLTTIEELVDPYYEDGEEGIQKEVEGLEVLGMKKLTTKHKMSWTHFGGSKFQPVKGVFRHKVNEIYEIEFNGGKIKTTANHSVFVRTKQGIQPKRVDELNLDDVLVDLPYKVNRTTPAKMEIRTHEFTFVKNQIKLPVYDKMVQNAYALLEANQITPNQVAKTVGVHITTALGWKRRDQVPFHYRYNQTGIPNEVVVTPELMKLFGYYIAEGYARFELDFCFGAKEENLINEVKDLMRRVFHVEPDRIIVTKNRCNIVYHKKPLAHFFARYCGKGAHRKKLPSFFFQLPKEYFLSFLKAYLNGDGYKYKDGKLEATSVSKLLVMELNWLCRMHGIKSYVHQFTAKEGRTINGGKPLKATKAYRLGIGKTNNPFTIIEKAPAQGLARIKKITKKPFEWFVYDLCGCEEEAFFGGEAPILLHNTNRINSLDEALRRPGRFDREIDIGVPTKDGRQKILQIHTRGMPLAKEVDLDYFAKITHGFVGADLEALTKEAAMKALRRYLPKINLEEETIPVEVLEKLEVNKRDFMQALRDVQPSALREVTIEVPNVKWVDIGGIENVKKELRQAIEWPLKHPEQFKKLGITPPRGILIYGPPGTGKTLLAKAVATESESNFISVKGPQLVSMWVGESLPFDEELLVFDGKRIFREKIGKIVEEKKKLKVVTFDSDGRTLFAEIKDFIKHPLNGKMFELTTKTGRKIRVTDKHSLFGLKNEEIEPMTVKELVEEKSVIAIPSRIPNISLGIKEINLFEVLYSNEEIMIKNINKEIKTVIKKIGSDTVSRILKVKKKYLYDIVRKNLPVKACLYYKLTKKTDIKTNFSKTKIGFRRAKNYISTILPLTDGLFRLVGQWVAEGDYNSNVVRIHSCNDEMKKDLIKTIKELELGNCSIFETSIVINSYIFKDVLRTAFGLQEGAFNKRVPEILFTCDSSKAASFLKGYFSGDGTISKNERSYYVEATSVNKELANDLMYLLLKFGIIANFSQRKEWDNTPSYRVRIHGVDNFKKFVQIGFIDKHRDKKILQNIIEKKWTRSNLIPMSEKIKNVLDEAFGSYPNNNYVGTKKLKQALQTIDLNKIRFSKLWKLVEADIYWDKVQSIKEIPYKGAVYDVSVEPCQNFLAGFGGIFAHNTEKAIRKVFHRARQVSPVIVFFDEIDAIASNRGVHADSGVSERAVNQLLTELDGIEALKDVVFIAATNRPDMIDTALLRPGRIDKLIRINAPDEKGRFSILKVHSKKMTLAQDISLEELARKTDGYTGADLEGLLKEAALISLERNKMEAKSVTKEDIEAAMKKVRASITKEIIEAYDQFKDSTHIAKPTYVR